MTGLRNRRTRRRTLAGIAKALAAEGAELAFTYQGEALGKRVKPLAGTLAADAERLEDEVRHFLSDVRAA